MFKIQGYLHGQTVFTDHIHYLLKGGKLMKCALEVVNNYRVMSSKTVYPPHHHQDRLPRSIIHYEKGRAHEVPVFDFTGKRINYWKKRNFLVKAENLPKQFGFEVVVKNLHYDHN